MPGSAHGWKKRATFTGYRGATMLDRPTEEIKLRTLVIRIFPNAAACLRLAGALTVETYEKRI